MTKMAPCCAKLHTQAARSEGDIAHIARRLSNPRLKEATSARLRSALQAEKQNLAEIRRRQEDHDAEHAGQVA